MREYDREHLPDEPTLGDYGHAVIKAGLSAIPVLGGGAVELFSLLFAAPLAERRDVWLQTVVEDLDALSRKVAGGSLESLAANPEFVSALMKATQVALCTHQQEKITALRNAVLNVAAGAAPEDDLQSIFLNLIDTLSPIHLRLFKQFGLKTAVLIRDAPNWLKSDVCSQAAKDLLDRGLLGPLGSLVPDRNQLVIGDNGYYKFYAATTTLGNQFLSFILSPLALPS
jgi:hypothetical protein